MAGIFLAGLGVLLYYMSTASGMIPVGCSSLAQLCLGLGSIAMLLALVPTQSTSIWFTTGGFFLFGVGYEVLITMHFRSMINDPDPRRSVPVMDEQHAELPDWYVTTFTVLYPFHSTSALSVFASCLYLVWRQPPPRRHLEVLWKTLAAAGFCLSVQSGVETVIVAAAGFARPKVYLPHLGDCAAMALVGGLSAWPGLRVRMQAWLAEQGNHASVATAVGTLVCSRPLDELLPLAKERFRCVLLDRVTQEMMAKSEPDPALAAISQPAALGDVDAFLSHSWSDDPEEKWEALQAWREEFRLSMGREPRVWIDKFCIDQRNINESLAGLPIFLAGCDKLLVLHGDTYQTRLWCLLEIFTFIVMDGLPENLVVRQLRSCTADFNTFDARGARCFNDSDTSHLLGIIETGLGTIHNFNDAVRDVVGKRSSVRKPSASSVSSSLPTLPWPWAGGGTRSQVSGGEPGDGLDRVAVMVDGREVKVEQCDILSI